MNPLDTTSTPNAPIIPASLEYAGLLTILSLLIMVASYYLHISPESSLTKAMNWGVPIGGVFWFLWHYKTKKNNQILEFRTGFQLSALTGLLTGLFSAIGAFAFMTWIAPDYSQTLLESSIRVMQQQGQSEEVIKQSLPYIEFFFKPIAIAGMILIMTFISYCIIGLIATAIMKKDRI
jgi:Protein of unknown function (DUF4199)